MHGNRMMSALWNHSPRAVRERFPRRRAGAGRYCKNADGSLCARTSCDWRQLEFPGMRLKSGQQLGDAYAYLEANLPVVRQRLYQASVRLALVLNEALP
jgi:hypothetical protein